MEKIVIEGKTYTLLDRDEVTYLAKYHIERLASKYNEMKGNYEESIRKRTKLADKNERLKYELETAELELQAVRRDRDIQRMVAKRWEARVENIGSRETLVEKLNTMSTRRKALQEVVDELQAQNERERTRVHELTIDRDAGRRIIKEYSEALSELEDEKKRLYSTLEEERWQYCQEHNEAKKTRIHDTLFSRAMLKMKKGGKE